MLRKSLIPALLMAVTAISLPAQEEFNCFTVMAGKSATNDGSVLVAHNEDDFGKQLVNWYAVPRKAWHEGSEFLLKNGGRIGQPAFTNRYVWLEIPGMDFSDCYLNEYGVSVSSNSCSSREDQPELTDGGIGYNLRQLMAERAGSAREAVALAGMLVEKFGYTGSGRTYCVADRNEAWALAVVKGKHWVARRVPDDQVMILPNCYTIREVNLDDPSNFLGSPDLVSYAVKRGWYKPETDGPFVFCKAYAGKGSLSHPGNTSRAWGAYHLFGTGHSQTDEFPFAFKPAKPVDKRFLMELLRNHYQGTELDKTAGFTEGSPYELNGTMICDIGTVYGFVAQLRNDMPVDLGCVMWLAPQWPDIQPFIPLYAGVTGFPPEFSRPGYLNSIDDHYNPPADIHERDDHHAFWAFVRFSEGMNADYPRQIGKVRKRIDKMEKALEALQPVIENSLMKNAAEDPEMIRKTVTELYAKFAGKALAQTRRSVRRMDR